MHLHGNEVPDMRYEVGQVFRNIYHFREVMKDYLRMYDNHKEIKNDSDRIKCIWKGSEFLWMILASLMNDGTSFQVIHCMLLINEIAVTFVMLLMIVIGSSV